MEYTEFQALLAQVRDRDPKAIEQWLDLVEPHIRLAVSTNANAPRLRRWRGSSDNLQSVLVMCFQQNWPERFVGRTFPEAIQYLKTAAMRTIVRHVRKLDKAKLAQSEPRFEFFEDSQGTPDDAVAAAENHQELLDALRDACSSEDQWEMVQQLLEGDGYAAVARERQLRPDTVRMAYNRIVERAHHKLQG